MIPVEDNFEDVLGKAMRGLGRSVGQVSEKTGCDEGDLNELLDGKRNDELMVRLAPELDLNPESLLALARGAEAPSVRLPQIVQLHNTPYPVPGYEEMTVNSFSIIPKGEAVCHLIDAGVSAEVMVSLMKEKATQLDCLFLTHTHSDHVASYEALSALAQKCYSPEGESCESACPVGEGSVFELGGGLSLTALLTPGHSWGGTTYLLGGAETPIAFVGDAIFCLSMGKAVGAFDSAKAAIREKILGLPDEAILCPGHGPVTTVAYEKANNPFFA